MSVQVMRVTARCPSCGAPPRIRVFPAAKRILATERGEEPFQSYQCSRELKDGAICNTVYEILVRDFHLAS